MSVLISAGLVSGCREIWSFLMEVIPSLSMVFPCTRDVTIVFIAKLSDLEILGTPLYKGVHTPRVIFRPTPGRSHFDCRFWYVPVQNCSKWQTLWAREGNVLCVDGLPENKLNRAWSTTKVSLYHNWFIFRVICNDIVEYRAVRVAKGLEKGLGCQKELARGPASNPLSQCLADAPKSTTPPTKRWHYRWHVNPHIGQYTPHQDWTNISLLFQRD